MSRDERGSATIEFIWLGLTLLVPLVYIVVSVFEVQRAAFGVSAASRSAARAFVLAPDPSVAVDRARAAAEVTLADHGVEGALIHIRCLPSCEVPEAVVEVRIEASAALPLAPTIMGDDLASVGVNGSHREPLGQYRSRE